jgi:peptidyl-prolyl cis-trans isomerase A (cyclophilin A)
MFRLILSVVVFGLIPLAGAQEEQVDAPDKKGEAQAQQPAAQEETSEAGEASGALLHPRVKMTTTLGDIVLELNAEKAPITVKNFLLYIEKEYYNGTIFHRIVHQGPNSAIDVIQGGGYTTEMDEKKEGLRPPIRNEWQNGLKNERGTISMARSAAPNSATSQFFINTADNASLDMPRGGAAYAVFGKVVEGMDVVDKIRNTELTEQPKLPMGKVVPVEPIEIKSATLLGGLEYEAVYRAIKKAFVAQEEARKGAGAQTEEEKAALAREFQELLTKRVDKDGNKLQTTESGLMYVVLKAGDGPSPKPTDVITAHYTGWLLDGTKFDSSHDRNRPLTYRLDKLIKGWIEGVGMMKAGGKRRLIIPPQLGYGERGSGPVPPNATLVFDMELLEVK